MIFVYTTCSSKKEAEKIAAGLIECKLISDANYFPCDSVYAGDKGPSFASEYIMLIKTEGIRIQTKSFII